MYKIDVERDTLNSDKWKQNLQSGLLVFLLNRNKIKPENMKYPKSFL